MKRFALAVAVLFCSFAPLEAQEYRATLLGIVSDPSGAAVSGAGIAVTNTATGVVTKSESNSTGSYVIPYLQPGTYRLTVEATGFKALERGPISLRVNDRVRIDVQLEVGEMRDMVTVTAEAPLLETASGSRGQVIEGRSITDLPLGGKNPFVLSGLANGVQFGGNLQYARPFDIGSASNFGVNGGRMGVNEYQIDGVSDNVLSAGPRMGYVPPVGDAGVQGPDEHL